MKEYEFRVGFYETYGSFTVEANNIDEAYDKAWAEIMESLKDLPVEVDYDVDCIEEPDDEDDDEDEEEYYD